MRHSSIFAKGLILVIFLAATSCQKSGSNAALTNDSSSQEQPGYAYPVQGSINGQGWVFTQGRATPFARNGHTYLDIRLWNQTYANPCAEMNGSILQMRLYAENFAGVWQIDPMDPFSLIPMVMFEDLQQVIAPKNNMVASEGQITLNSVSASGVSGSVSGGFPSDAVGKSQISGDFSVVYCAPQSGSN